MHRTYSTSNQKELRRIYSLLTRLYPESKSELNFKDNYQLLVAVVLSAQCTDKKVNSVTPELFSAFPDIQGLSQARLATLEKIIRPINYYRTKSRHLKALAQQTLKTFKGQIPATMEELMALPGVGRKTASVILSETGQAQTLPVDTHVFRVSRRLGLSNGKNVGEVERDLRLRFKPKDWQGLHHRLIFHGRRICQARKPDCGSCLLNKFCLNRPTQE